MKVLKILNLKVKSNLSLIYKLYKNNKKRIL